MRWLAILLGVASGACGAKARPQAFGNTKMDLPTPQRSGPSPTYTARRPDIDVSVAIPDFHEELRWPLSGMNHPALEPRYPIAQELAIGVDWQQLCARGVDKRVSAAQRDLLAYLRGWCGVAKRDIDAACRYLSPLLGSIESGLRPAVRQDLANILVEHGNADKAEHWLTKHHIKDVQVLDLLAASYVEVGSLADAFAINRRAIDNDDHATDATKCRRLVRRVVINLEHETVAAYKQLKAIAIDAKVPDPTCARLYNKVECWRNREMCAGYYNDENVDERTRLLVDTYYAWPDSGTLTDWWSYADKARLSIPTPGASELALSALENAVQAGDGCPLGLATSVQHAIEEIRRDHAAIGLTARLERLKQKCPTQTAPALPAASAAPGAALP